MEILPSVEGGHQDKHDPKERADAAPHADGNRFSDPNTAAMIALDRCNSAVRHTLGRNGHARPGLHEHALGVGMDQGRCHALPAVEADDDARADVDLLLGHAVHVAEKVRDDIK